MTASGARAPLLAWALAAACGAPALGLAAGPATRETRAPYLGTWRVDAATRVRAAPVVERDVESRVDLVVREGRDRRAVWLELAAEGYACRVEARVGDDGALGLAPGQRCPLKLDEPGARGDVEARVASGRARLRDGTLELELALDLSGSVSARVEGGTVSVLGREVVLPDGWAPALPLRGSAAVRGVGRRAAPEEPQPRAGPKPEAEAKPGAEPKPRRDPGARGEPARAKPDPG